MPAELAQTVTPPEALIRLKDEPFVARLRDLKGAFVRKGIYWHTEKPLIDQSPLAAELAPKNRYKATLAAVLQKRTGKAINKADFDLYKPLAKEIQNLADGLGFDSKDPDINIVAFIECCLDKVGIPEAEIKDEKQETQLVKLTQNHLDRLDPRKHPERADQLKEQFKTKKNGAWSAEVAEIITSDRALRELITTNSRITPLLIYDLENLLRRSLDSGEMKDVRKMAKALIKLADHCQLYSSEKDLDLLGFVRAARFKAGYTTKEYEQKLKKTRSDLSQPNLRTEHKPSRIPWKLLPIPIAVGILGLIGHLQGLPIYQAQQPEIPIVPASKSAPLPVNYHDTSKSEPPPLSAPKNTDNKLLSIQPVQPELPMPQFKFKYKINNPPESISKEFLGDPPDIGTAYQMALWGDPYWQNVFLEAYKGANIQSSVRMNWNSNENKPVPSKYSWGDYIHLSQRQAPNNQYIINIDPDSGKSAFKDVVFQENIILPNGKTISGIKIFDHQAKGIGILEKLWFTTSPNQKSDLLGRSEVIHGPNVLAEIINKIYIVIDGKTVISYDPVSLFSGKDPTLGRYENGGFLFNPLLPYKNSQVYLTSRAYQGDTNRYQGSQRHGDLWDQLFYRVIGQDFDEKVTSTLPVLQADSKVRTEFLRNYRQVQNSIIKEEFPIKERILVENSWTKIIENSGVGRFTFRVPSPKDLENTHLNIKYPEPDIPEVNIKLSELVGTKNAKFSFANRFISFTTTDNGGLTVDFNQSISLPQGTKITISTSGKTKAEILWQHRADQIDNLRFGVFHQRLERAQSKDGRQFFNPLPKDFIVRQQMFYIDNPGIDIDKYNSDNVTGSIGNVEWYFAWNEGNIYLRNPDGSLIPLSNGIEELGDAAFYAGDAEGKTGFVPAEKPAGDSHKMYYYGRGHYNLVFANDKLVKAEQIDPENMFVLGYTNSNLMMKKGSQILAMPGFATFESAGVELTMFGYYRVPDNTIVTKEKGQSSISETRLFNPTRLNTSISLNSMEDVANSQQLKDKLVITKPGSFSRFQATQESFDSKGHLNNKKFYNHADQIVALSESGINQAALLEVIEENSNEWIENAVKETIMLTKPKMLILGNEFNLKGFKYKNTEKYFQQLIVAYRTAKTLDPNIKVYPYGISPGGIYDYEEPSRVLDEMLQFFDKHPYTPNQKYPFDGINIHSYFPDQIISGIPILKDVLRKHNADLPIIVGEAGLPVNDKKQREWDSFINTPNDQANYLWQSLALNQAEGVSFINYFDSKDVYQSTDVKNEFLYVSWGLTRLDGTPRPAYDAFIFAQRIFNNIVNLEYNIQDDLSKLTLHRSDGARVRILWNNSKTPKSYFDIANNTLIYDKYGNKVNPTTKAGKTSIELSERLTEFVGGEVIIIVDLDIDQ